MGDDERGYLLELLLTKLRYCNDKQAGRMGRMTQDAANQDAANQNASSMDDPAELEGLQTST